MVSDAIPALNVPYTIPYSVKVNLLERASNWKLFLKTVNIFSSAANHLNNATTKRHLTKG